MDHRDFALQAPADPIQVSLDAVTRRLVRPHFLSTLTPSRLPSQAASDSSLSPHEAPHLGPGAPHLRSSQLRRTITSEPQSQHAIIEDAATEEIQFCDLVAPLIQDPPADVEHSNAPDFQLHCVPGPVHHHLETRFLAARRACATTVMADRSFQTFAHRHQDLVLAVDFNYFGTRMVTASSDHRLKVWDKKDDAWTLVESWKAHDAEVLDVSAFSAPSAPRAAKRSHFATLVLRARHG